MSTRTGAAAVTPEARDKAYYVGVAIKAAQAAGIPESGFVAQIQQESGFNPKAGSPAGAQGIAQFMPDTARSMGVDPWNPEQALYGAARLMRKEYDKYGRWDLALAAYNGGPRRADALRDGRPIPEETRNYVALLAPKYGGVSTNPADIIRGTNTGIPTPSQSPQPGERVVGAIGDAVGGALDIPSRIIGFLQSIGLRLLYVIGGMAMMGLGLVVVFRTMAADTIQKAVGS
jgi:hypothetical protein